LPDLRKYAQQTKNRLVIGLLVLVATVGIFLICLFYGKNAALLGLICLGAILIPILLILLVLYIIERIANNGKKE
jgi:energy-converting hydrogenase Eha subunit E